MNYNRAAGMSYEAGYKQCGMAALNLLPLEIQIEAKKLLPATLMQTAQAAASNWTKGGAEQLLPAPVITATQDGKPDAKSNGRREVAAIAPRLAPGTSRQSAATEKSLSRVEVPLKNDGGIFVVPVEINGAITLEFAIDSGAADVGVPADVFSTLVRTGTIKDSDMIGEETYVLADGSKIAVIHFHN